MTLAKEQKSITGIVIVNYKTPELTISYVKNELAKIPDPWRLVIVDVAGSEESVLQIKTGIGAVQVKDIEGSLKPEAPIYLISTAENIGFARGNNLGVRFLSKHFQNIDCFLFTNNDIKIIHSDVVDKLREALTLPGVGAVGPHVDGPFGRQGPAWKRKSINEEILLKLFYPLTWPLFRRIHNERIKPAASGFCYSAVGCFFMVSRKAFEACGGFDPVTFLYGEEDILAERLLKCNYHYYFLGDRRVIHEVGGVIRQFLAQSKSDQLRQESQIYYYKTYRHASKIQLVLYRFANLLFTRVTEIIVHKLKQWIT